MHSKNRKVRYVRVRDNAGNLFVCPIDALRNPKELTGEETDACVDDGTVGRYPGDIDIVDD